MPTARNGHGVWKWISGILCSVLLTGAVSWFSFGGGVSRAGVSEQIKTESPYREDREFIRSSLERIEKKLDRMDRDQHK